MTTLTVTEAQVGETIATGGAVAAIRFTQAPSGYRERFCLVDDGGPGAPITLLNIDVSTSWMTPVFCQGLSNALLANGNIPFGNLTVVSVPTGATFEVDTQ